MHQLCLLQCCPCKTCTDHSSRGIEAGEKCFVRTRRTYNQILLKYEDASDDFQDKIGNYLLNRSEVQAVTFISTTVDWAGGTLSSLNN